MKIVSAIVAVMLMTVVLSCREAPPPAPISIRLVDLYKPQSVEGRSSRKSGALPRTEWKFDQASLESSEDNYSEAGDLEGGPGVSTLVVENGFLSGKSTTYFPLLHLERKSGLEDRDLFHSLQIRMRVSAGTELSAFYLADKTIDLNKVVEDAKDFPWEVKAKLVPGEKVQTYTLLDRRPPAAADIRHLLIRPTNVVGATFDIESIRLIFRKEYLAEIPSGIRWEGLSQIYQETIVSHAPEKISFDTVLSQRPWLDLSVGTLENEPVTFRAAIQDSAGKTMFMERTLTTPNRWERLQVDLSKHANRRVSMKLSLQAEHPGAIGFWGSPVIRSSGAMPKTASGKFTPPQGIIFIMADTLRRDHLDAYGYKRSTAPHIRRLATEGTLFQDCISQATWTKVAAPSLFTSLYPTSHGVHDFSDRLPVSAVTMAEVFRDAGYATLSLSSILFTGAFTNMQQGFEELHEDTSLPDRHSSKTARVYVDRLLPWLENHREVPFFVSLHIADPHDPYRPYPPYDTLWANPAKNARHEQDMNEVRRQISNPLLRSFSMPSREELEHANLDPEEYIQHDRDWYDGSIRAMDAEIGRLIERLRTIGLDRKTLIVFVSDHGEEFLEHGRSFHGQSVYGELTNVPLILWAPGLIPKGKSVANTVETIDVMPTVLELSRLSVPAAVQGKSFLPLLFTEPARADNSGSNRRAISEKAATLSPGAPPPHDTESYSIVSGGWKLIHNSKRPEETPEYELYDETKDPLNLSDLSSRHPEIVRRLAKELDAWHKSTIASRLKPDSETSKELNPEELERLRSLGYISD